MAGRGRGGEGVAGSRSLPFTTPHPPCPPLPHPRPSPRPQAGPHAGRTLQHESTITTARHVAGGGYLSPFSGKATTCVQTLRIAPDLIINKVSKHRKWVLRPVHEQKKT